MGVIINEFEVVNEQPSAPASIDQLTEALPPVTTPPQPLSPAEIVDILRHRTARAARVRAH